MSELLIEIGCEELPPKALKLLGSTLGSNFEKQLTENRFEFEKVRWLAAPRRLAISVAGLNQTQPDIEIAKKGPSVKAAFDEKGEPTRAALGWAKSNGINIKEAETIETPKGQWLQTVVKQLGKNIDSCLSDMLSKALSGLPVPKVMRWGDSEFQFVRPVHNICCMVDEKEIPAEVLGVKSNNKVLGHRFHSPGLHDLKSASAYSSRLKDLNVVVDFAERVSLIESQLQISAKEFNAIAVYDIDLLEEVASLVEWPVVLQAEFDKEFLNVPKEALIYTMKDDQKYFALLDESTNSLKNQFLFVSNIESNNPNSVIEGNQKVVRPRLADAQFFYDSDLKVSSDTRLDSLNQILFQKGLGTLRDKSERISEVSGRLASVFGGDISKAELAGKLSKTDLVSKVVYEFPEVQGVMGFYYAKAEGVDLEIAEAVRDHYLPKHASDDLPKGVTAQSVAIADRLDTLVGIFSLGLLPKGDKDPFALRRAVLGAVKIIFDANLQISLDQLINFSLESYGDLVSSDKVKQLKADLSKFVSTRLENYFVEQQGVTVNLARSVITVHDSQLNEVALKVHSLSSCMTDNSEVMESLIASNKRIANILSKSSLTHEQLNLDESLLIDSYEVALHKSVNRFTQNTDNLAFNSIEQVDSYLDNLLQFKVVVNEFFDNVMVNVEDEKVKSNRFALLSLVRNQFLRIADFSTLQG